MCERDFNLDILDNLEENPLIVKKLKRRMLGICGSRGVKSLNELSEFFIQEYGVDQSSAQSTVRDIATYHTLVGLTYGRFSEITITRVPNSEEELYSLNVVRSIENYSCAKTS